MSAAVASSSSARSSESSAPLHSASAVSKYIPRIASRTDENGQLNFTIDRINVSLANALRRVILSDIPTFVFRTFPYAECKASITVNTSRIHNEIIKQRLSCIPIHITDTDFTFQEYQLEINVTADGNEIRYVTTKDFRMKNKVTGKYLTDVKVREIFPPNATSGDFIEFARLLPKMTEYGEGEQLAMTCDLDIGTAKEDGMFNVVCTCAYQMTMDAAKVDEAWRIKEAELVKEGVAAIGSEEMKAQRKNWSLLDAQRQTKEDSFDFVVETVGVYTNADIVSKAAQIMINKCTKFIRDIEKGENHIIPTVSTIQNGFDIELKGEDYTLGKVLEFFMHDKHYAEDQTVTYCAFRKVHPHNPDSLIRVGFAETVGVDEGIVAQYITTCARDAIVVFEHIRDQFREY
jgi:DNA-directed RNA polymerase I and III subunit RPAC1